MKYCSLIVRIQEFVINLCIAIDTNESTIWPLLPILSEAFYMCYMTHKKSLFFER